MRCGSMAGCGLAGFMNADAYDGEVCLGGGPIDSTTPMKEIVLKNI